MTNIKKGIISLLLTAFVSYSPVYAQSATTSYESKSGYSLKYPNGWVTQDRSSPVNVVLFKSPLESKSDNFAENVNVIVEKAPGYTTEQYYQLNLKSINENHTLTNFKILESGNKIIYGKTGKYIIYTHTYNNIPLKVKTYFFTNGQSGYVITCTAKPDTFNAYLPTFEDIISTFKLIVNGIHI